MKTKNTILVTIIAGMVILLTVFSCDTKKEKPGQENTPVEVKVKKIIPKESLHVAAIKGDLEVIQQHVDAGSDLNQKEPSMGSSPMITAVTFGKTEVVKALIDAGADVNFTNIEGSTALHVAAFFCHTDIVEMLLENGIDKEITNKAGRRALESVTASFESVKEIYDGFGASLGPIGLQLDYDYLKETRPKIAEMLK